MHCLFAPWSAYFYIFKDYFTPDGEYPTSNGSTTGALKYYYLNSIPNSHLYLHIRLGFDAIFHR